MSEKPESDDFDEDDVEDVSDGAERVDVDRAIRDLDQARRRGPKTGDPAWRRLERVMEEKRTAELTSDFENILRNAIRYAPADSAVAVDVARAGDEYAVTIADRGPGVPPEYLERIFEPYVRVPDSTGGTGLGLAIARRVFEAHGGRVTASLREGGGLSVCVRLPAAQVS